MNQCVLLVPPYGPGTFTPKQNMCGEAIVQTISKTEISKGNSGGTCPDMSFDLPKRLKAEACSTETRTAEIVASDCDARTALDSFDQIPNVFHARVAAFSDHSAAIPYELRQTPPVRRSLGAILVTDIQGSTELAVKLGDVEWCKLIDAHDAAAKSVIRFFGGTWIKGMGDGILATFPTASDAIACAKSLLRAAAFLGLSVRAGIHVGEYIRRGGDIAGIAVTTAARILDSTPGGECRVSTAVRELVAGSGQQFDAAGRHSLRGLPGDYILHTVSL